MKSFLLFIFLTVALACQTLAADHPNRVCQIGTLRIHLYTGAMVISDVSLPGGRTIARFTKDEGTLSIHKTTYEGNVDLRRTNSMHGWMNILDTTLDQVDWVTVETYSPGNEFIQLHMRRKRGKLPTVEYLQCSP